ncbi:MAG: nucleotidyltransferase family protein [Treponema sp.]|nr:nucleotidyltransferase family protein [Treponema sp.]
MNDTIDAILMAAGFSQRFGDANKLLAPFRGKALARHTLDLVCGIACFRRVLFIVADDAVRALAEGLPVSVIHNKHPEFGQRESIRLGVAASDAAYYVFFPCDQPLLDEATVCAILAQRTEGRITQPMYAGTPASPTLYSAAFRSELLALAEGEPGSVIKKRHPEALYSVEVASSLALLDIDTPETLRSLEVC